MLKPNIFAVIVILLWGALIWSGLGLMQNVADRHIAGYPSSGQFRYYVGIPTTLVACGLAALVVFNFVKRDRVWLFAGSAMLLAALPLYMVLYFGGM